MRIEVQHRGYTIRFNENADEWSCMDVQTAKGYLGSPSLSKVRAGIDKMLLDQRKAAAAPAFILNGGHECNPKRQEATIIEYLGRAHVYRHSAPQGSRNADGQHQVAAVSSAGQLGKVARRTHNISDLMPDTPEAHAAFASAEEKAALAREAMKVARAAYDAIPRVTIDIIPELVRIAKDGEPSDA